MTQQTETEAQNPRGIFGWIFGGVAAMVFAIAMIIMLIVISAVVVLGGQQEQQDSQAGCQPISRSDDGVTQNAPEAPEDVKKEQIKNAKAIDDAVKEVGLPGKATELAVITAMGESTLINVDYGDQDQGVTNPDGTAATSYGLFQQQTSMGWGTKDEVMDPTYATKSFLLGPKHDGAAGLVSIEGWETREPTQVIHEVQDNADANHYVASYETARSIIKEAGIDTSRDGDDQKMEAAGVDGDDTGGSKKATTTLNDDCSSAVKAWGGDLGDGEWTIPLPNSNKTGAGGFGARDIAGYPGWANDHTGVDLATDMGSYGEGGPVVAPADMEVLSFYKPDGCVYGRLTGEDDPKFGIGFCHLAEINVSEGDKLSRGDVLGTEGNLGQSLGNSQGGSGFITHLHFELFPPETPDAEIKPLSGKQIDPEPILRKKGAWPDSQAA